MAIAASRPGGVAPVSETSASSDYGPAQLRSAYKLSNASATKGKGATVAIVDAFSDPDAARDLSHYRSHFHLSACTPHNGCLRIVNQSGHAGPLPQARAGWATEQSLDLDMVSAICPNCHILLVEARNAVISDLGAAEDTAIAKGARFVSNSWAGPEFFGQDEFDSDFNHPGNVLAFAAGDTGYDPAYPADLQYVTAVGGTSLRRVRNGRGWTESAWGSATAGAEGTAGGCSEARAQAVVAASRRQRIGWLPEPDRE